MDGPGFDCLARKFGARADRRVVIRGLAGGALAATGLLAVTSMADAKDEKALICHHTDDPSNPYNLIEVSVKAVPTHEAHGDYSPYDCGNGPQCRGCFPEICTEGRAGVDSGDP